MKSGKYRYLNVAWDCKPNLHFKYRKSSRSLP